MTDGAVIVGPATHPAARAVAAGLAAQGAPLVLVDRDADTVQRAAGELADAGATVAARVGDPGDPEVGARAVSDAVELAGAIAAVVPVLGPARAGPFPSSTADGWDAVLAEQVRPLYGLVHPALPPMRDAGRGRVVSVSSRAWLGEAEHAEFAAAAAAVAGFTRSLALESGKYGITVNAVAQAYLDLDADDELAERARTVTAVRRPGTGADLAAAVGFLLSEQAGFVTGQILSLCGGSSIGKSIY